MLAGNFHNVYFILLKDTPYLHLAHIEREIASPARHLSLELATTLYISSNHHLLGGKCYNIFKLLTI
jgi:hypothetical protein